MSHPQVVALVLGILLGLSWVVIIVRRFYFAPIALAFAGATYLIAAFFGFILCMFSFGRVNPLEIAWQALRTVYVGTIVFIVTIIASIGYYFYLVTVLHI